MTHPSGWHDGDPELKARRASSFGPSAADYARYRPDYPLEAIRWALEPLGGKANPEVVDLGAGTGKLTSGLVAAGARVIAVEPDAAMRAEFARHHPDLPALDGSAETIPLPNDSVDAVLVGQAFHWFDQERAFPEIARVLRPGGVLAALSNGDDPSVDWVAQLRLVAWSHASVPPADDDRLPAHPRFEPFERAEFRHYQRQTADDLTATIGTHSHTLVITPAERAEVLGRIAEFLHARPETGSGEFELPLRTSTIRAVRR